MQKTFIPKAGDLSHEWMLVDAKDQTLGRLAAKISRYILGKGKTIFTPGVDNGDFVIVINAKQIRVTGNKLEDKMYYRHSGYPGGIKIISLRSQLATHPDRVIRHAVWGMLPHNKVGRQMINRLKVYAGAEHPHSAQNPKTLD